MQENGKSKTALFIEMLQLLNSGRTYKVSELAEELETKPRNIKNGVSSSFSSLP